MANTQALLYQFKASDSPVELAQAARTAQTMMTAWDAANKRHGSLIQAWVRGAAMQEHTHYPIGDVTDNLNGSQYFYHAHRGQGGEHGHLHLFWHANAKGNRRSSPVFQTGAPSHLFAISLDARGLPETIFTTNLWVTDGYWFDAATTAAMVGRFAVARGGRFSAADRWLNQFIALYRPAIELALVLRDRRVALLTRRRPWGTVSQDARHEVLSVVRLDLLSDLQTLESAVLA
jgi:hypothetical protein